MNIPAKIEQMIRIRNSSSAPLAIILDLMRIKRSNYTAECMGFNFEIQARSHEWYTLYENVIRQDYFSDGIVVHEGDIVIDIGANFGSFAIVAARKVGATGEVVAFEPNPDVCERLVRNISINALHNVTVRNEAVSGNDGEIVLLLQKRSSLTTSFSSIDQRSSEAVRPINVKSISLNNILRAIGKPVSLVKIDCEGAEYDIFDYIENDLISKVRQFTMELHDVDGRSASEIVDKLKGFGFIVNDRYPMLTAVRS